MTEQFVLLGNRSMKDEQSILIWLIIGAVALTVLILSALISVYTYKHPKPFGKVLASVRPNILLMAIFVFTIVMFLAWILSGLVDNGGGGTGATGNSGNNEFLKGALIGLIGTGITALTALGNNILEKDNSPSRNSPEDRN